MDCLFCGIIEGSVPSAKLYEDDQMLIFKDINPQAPFHALAVPKRHIESVADLQSEDAALAGHILVKIAENAPAFGLQGGFRVSANSGADACRSVEHLHFHILGKKQLSQLMG